MQEVEVKKWPVKSNENKARLLKNAYSTSLEGMQAWEAANLSW